MVASGAEPGGDATLARNLAANCTPCHGTNGVSQGVMETLAGQKKEDLARKMAEFRAGTRPGTIMPQLAKGYTPAQIDLIAEWFADQKAPR